MSTVITLNETFVSMWLEDTLRMRKPIPGATKIVTARNEAYVRGYVAAMCQSLAIWLTHVRLENVRSLRLPDAEKCLPAVTGHQARVWWKRFVDDWDTDKYANYTDEEVTIEVTSFLMEHFILTGDFAESFEHHRRKAVKAGLIDPLPSDADWIREEYHAMMAAVEPYRKLLNKVEPGEKF